MGNKSERTGSPAPLIPASSGTLDEDPDTSMVQSLRLHLVSEHAISDAVTMKELDAERLHRQLHLTAEQSHLQNDLRFRPGRVLRALSHVPRPRRSHEIH